MFVVLALIGHRHMHEAVLGTQCHNYIVEDGDIGCYYPVRENAWVNCCKLLGCSNRSNQNQPKMIIQILRKSAIPHSQQYLSQYVSEIANFSQRLS